MHFLDEIPLPIDEYSTDACTIGGAGYYNNDWFYCNWAVDYPDIANKDIWMKELFTILVSARRWAPLWNAKHILVHTDNMASVFIINKGTAHDSVVMSWVRELFWLSVKYGFYITAKHICGKDNCLSDMISRMHDLKFMFKTCMTLNLSPIVYPDGSFVFNVYGHMSKRSYELLQEVFKAGSGRGFTRNCCAIEERHIQKIQGKHITPCIWPI